MRISYNNLRKLLIDKEMKKIDLLKIDGINNNTLATIGKNEPISIKAILKICEALHCDVGDVLQVIHNDEK